MAFATVPVGRYFGCTKAQLLTRLDTLRTAALARVPGQGALVSVAGNGMSASYDHRAPGAVTLEQEIDDLLSALALVDDDAIELTSEQTFSA
jgi:hypothetical protein